MYAHIMLTHNINSLHTRSNYNTPEGLPDSVVHALITEIIPHPQKLVASDWLFSSVFFFNTRA